MTDLLARIGIAIAENWCADMTTWMRQRSNGDWNGSMMNASTTGGG